MAPAAAFGPATICATVHGPPLRPHSASTCLMASTNMNAICSSRLREIFPLASSTSTVAFVAIAPVAACPAGRAKPAAAAAQISAHAKIAAASFANFVIKGILLNSDGNVSSVKGRHKTKVSGSVRCYDPLAKSSDGGKMGVKFEAVRKFVLSLEDVEEVRSYGTPGFKMRGVLFARLKEDGETLVVRMEF